MKIYSIVVTYNPDVSELHKLIDLLQAQTARVVVCNNSDWPLDLPDASVKLFNFGENLGIAEAQSIGMKWCFENGADFVLQMDQDSVPTPTMVSELYKSHQALTGKGYRVGLIGVQDFDKETLEENQARVRKGRAVPGTNYEIVPEILSSGSLIPKAAYEAVGGMEDGLFLDCVDFEYCWRLRREGFMVFKNADARLGHRLGEGRTKILGFLAVGRPAPIRHYYAFRNGLFLLQRSYAPTYWKLSTIAKLAFKLVFYPIFLDRGSVRLKFMLRGLWAGMSGEYGRIPE